MAALDSWRNRAAQRACNLILNLLATEEYRLIIDGAIRLGLATAASRVAKRGADDG